MRIIAAVLLGLGMLTVSQCWAHGGHSSPPGMSSPQGFSLPDSARSPSRDIPPPETTHPKNPYENMSCPELYVLAEQSEQSFDLAQAFKDKDCHAL